MKKQTASKIAESYWKTEAGQKIAWGMHRDGWEASDCLGSVIDILDAGIAATTDAICMKCAEEERRHPDYQLAADIELAAVRAGNRNFAGLGWPGKNGRIKQ